MSILPKASRRGEARHAYHWQLANLRRTGRYVSIKLLTGHGVSLTSRYFAVLGMPLVNTVTRLGPKKKSVTGREMKLVSDQRKFGETGRKATWLLSTLRNCTIG